MKLFPIPLLVVLFFQNSYSQISVPQNFSYPAAAIEKRVQGKVYVQFIALPTGEILDSTIQIVKGLGHGLDEIAIQAVKDASSIGRNNVTRLRKNEPTKFILPILFTLQPKDWANYYYMMGLKEYQENRVQEAINFYHQAISIINIKSEYYYALYNAYLRLGDVDEGCSFLKKAKKINKNYKSEWENECK